MERKNKKIGRKKRKKGRRKRISPPVTSPWLPALVILCGVYVYLFGGDTVGSESMVLPNQRSK